MKKLNTFLSDYVWHLLVELCDKTNKKEKLPDPKYNYINKTFLLDWNKIGLLFEGLKDDEDVLQKPESWYSSTVGKVWDVIHEAGLLLERVSNLKMLPLWELCTWTDAAEDIADLFLLLLQGNEENKLLILLHLTALLERALGNVFLLRGNSVPYLLKDLLSTPEIQHLLGRVPVTFVQILVGSPKGLNVRNVAWHGFISPHEVHPHLAAFFFVLIPSLGSCLKAYQTVPHRIQKTDFVTYTEYISNVFPCIDEELCSISEIISNCEHISLPHKSIWKYSFSLYINEKYGQCIELFLPQLEHVLRQLFCDVNDCPQRTVTAESTVLYTTLDEILAPSLPLSENTNKVHGVLGDGLSVLLNDILSDLAGPRLRDKISHGECYLTNLPKDLANYVYCAGLCVCVKAIIYKYTKMKSGHNESVVQCFANHVSSRTRAFIQKLLEVCDTYSSRYHVVSRLLQSVKHLLYREDQWPQFAISTANLEGHFNLEEIDSKHMRNLQSCLFGSSDISLTETSCKLCAILNNIRPKTLFRPRTEIELVSLLKNVTDKIESTQTKMKECLCLKYKQWEQHALRSRNRLTFQRMLQVLPDLQVVLLCMIGIIISFIQNVTSLQHGKWKSYIRFTKRMLQLAENMALYCTAEKNRWLEAHKTASEFSEISVQFLQEEPYLLIYSR